MDAQVTIEQLSCHADARGWVIEPLDEPSLSRQRNVHVVWTEPGGVRGNHYHRFSTEIMVVVGPALVRWREAGVVCERTVEEGEALRFTIPPGVPHAIQNTGPRPLILTSFSTHLHDRANPDTVREVLIEP
jgi:UDP-2-acetamido-2,6-beta-L-arabino-hexul-4-ose reductase